MILVAGATGCLGTEVVRRLVREASGEPVRVLTRDPARATKLTGEGHVEVAVGDVRDAAAVREAMKGVRVVVSAVHGFVGKGVDPRSVDLEGNKNLIAAAEACDVARFVLLSIYGVTPDHSMDLFRAKYFAEEALVASRLSWTIVKPTAFMETWLTLLGAPLLAKGKTTIFGRGKNPINFVSAHDVAAIVARAAIDETLRNERIDVGGPENLSFSQFVETFEKVTGASGATGHVPLPVMRVMAWLMRPMNAQLARMIRAGVTMDTEDFTFDASTPSVVPRTSLAEAIRRDFPSAPTL